MKVQHLNNTKKHHPHIKNSIVVGKIYADWCHYCQELIPVWKEMKKQLSGKNIIFKEIEQKLESQEINDINYTYLVGSNEKLVSKGYPTIFMIKNGKLNYFNGPRTAKTIADWTMTGGDVIKSTSDTNNKLFGLWGGKRKTKRNHGKRNRKTKKSWFSW